MRIESLFVFPDFSSSPVHLHSNSSPVHLQSARLSHNELEMNCLQIQFISSSSVMNTGPQGGRRPQGDHHTDVPPQSSCRRHGSGKNVSRAKILVRCRGGSWVHQSSPDQFEEPRSPGCPQGGDGRKQGSKGDGRKGEGMAKGDGGMMNSLPT